MKLELFENSDFLTKRQKSIIENIEKLFPSVPRGMTDYQIEQFVLNMDEHPTWYSVYYQCTLEIWSRFTSIFDVVSEIRLQKLRNRALRSKIEKLRKSDSEDRAKADVLEYKIEIAEQRNAIKMYDIEKRFKELECFNRVRELALKKYKGEMPEYGDNKEEKIKWGLKFLFNKAKPKDSLIGGRMNDKNLIKNISDFIDNHDNFDQKIYNEIFKLNKILPDGIKIKERNAR